MEKPPFLNAVADGLQALAAQLPQPPAWLQSECHNRLVLLLNHVLMQEPAATERLIRQQGKTLQVIWGRVELVLTPTPAGLLALSPTQTPCDLKLTVNEPSWLSFAQALLAGYKPAIEIQGDVQLAAEVNWLVDNVRWDVEEDLSRILGDVAAHTLVSQTRALVSALKAFVAQVASRTPLGPLAKDAA